MINSNNNTSTKLSAGSNQLIANSLAAFNDTSLVGNSMTSWIETTYADLFSTSDIAQPDYTNVQDDLLLNTDDSDFTSEFSSAVSSPFDSTNSSPLQSVASSPFASMVSSPAPSSAEYSPEPVGFSNQDITTKTRSRISNGSQKTKKNAKRKRLNNLPPVAKQQRKRLQNNNAALKYRLKKKEEVTSLSTTEKELEKDNMRLRQKIEATMSEITFLKSLLREIKQNRGNPILADR